MDFERPNVQQEAIGKTFILSNNQISELEFTNHNKSSYKISSVKFLEQYATFFYCISAFLLPFFIGEREKGKKFLYIQKVADC